MCHVLCMLEHTDGRASAGTGSLLEGTYQQKTQQQQTLLGHILTDHTSRCCSQSVPGTSPVQTRPANIMPAGSSSAKLLLLRHGTGRLGQDRLSLLIQPRRACARRPHAIYRLIQVVGEIIDLFPRSPRSFRRSRLYVAVQCSAEQQHDWI